MDILLLGDRVKEAIYEFVGRRDVEVTLEVPQSPEYGDLSTPYAFKAARVLGRRPLDLASDIRDHLLSLNIDYIADIRVEGGGYINIHLDRNRFYSDYFRRLVEEGLDLFRGRFGEGYVRIEYTSVNPNKAIHIGHARNILLGVALHRLLSSLGYRVHLMNYIDDTGVQMADLMLGFIELNFPLDPPNGMKFDKYCGDVVYVESVRRVEEERRLRDVERKILRALEEGDNPIYEYSRRVAERVVRAQLETCFRLGAKYDVLAWESDLVRSGLHNHLSKVIEASRKIIRVEEGRYAGAVVIKVSEGDEIDPKRDEVIVRSDGTLTYVGKDLVFAMWKLGLLDMHVPVDVFGENPDGSKIFTTRDSGLGYKPDPPDILLNVIGREQTKPQNAIREVLKEVYGEEVGGKYIHYSYELVKLSAESARKYFGVESEKSAVKMSGRRGLYFNVDDVLAKMVEIVYRHMVENKSIASEQEARQVAEKVAVASLMYQLIAIDRDKPIVFDIDKSLDFKGETGAYILYSYVRANSILSNAGESGDFNIDYSLLNMYDLGLSRFIVVAPIVIHSAVKYLEPKYIMTYLYRLAKSFNDFYERCPVLSSTDPVRRYRLAIVRAYASTVELLARLVGLPLVKKM